ncbi:class I lanthipeptide [Taibaiella chishuiensis]|uniref:Uncharacterized protein n=1 Tax=Taibaiella chishuiensis TaxID=1434707 RepID=A0A2P8D5H1_9BACT|nr:class I lanthipeptide [Taibaiella chishuiensis]PSK92456.1 hypothetical protein B0I18_10333 [Taibaiella chishuiensis]
MKKKQIVLKKLTLSKEVISELTTNTQQGVVGGVQSADTLCQICIRPITVTCRASVCDTYCNVPTCGGISQ